MNITTESTVAPSPFWFTEGTWDAADGYFLTYGGDSDNSAGTIYSDTWAFRGGTWTNVTTQGSPGPLDGPALAYDPPAHEVVLYGGLESYSPFLYTNLTWIYSGGVWSSYHTSPAPPARLAGSMVYDPDLGGVVLFGGYDNSNPSGGSMLNDTWLFKAGAWSHVAATNAPPDRAFTPLAYDPLLHSLVVFSGRSPATSNPCIYDSWVLHAGAWSQIKITGAPGGLCDNAIAFDPEIGHVVLAAGADNNTVPSTATWMFNGSAWLPLTVTGNPGAHEYGAAAWDPLDQAFIVAGGSASATTTYVLDRPLAVSNLSGPAHVETGQIAMFQANVTGGTLAHSVRWSWGDGNISTGSLSESHTYLAAGSYTVTVNASEMLGANAGASTSVVVAAGPRASINASSAVGDEGVPMSFVAVASGGSGGLIDNWSFGDGLSGSGTAIVHTYNVTGRFDVSLTVTDSAGGGAVVATTVQVFAPLNATLPSPPRTEVGVPATWTATVSGGAPTLRYAWSFDDAGSNATRNATHTFATAGAHSANFTATDGAHVARSAQVNFLTSVHVSLQIVGQSAATVGANTSWSTEVTGGYGPYVVAWTFPSGPVVDGAAVSYTFDSAGTVLVHATVRDALGAVSKANLTLTVSAPSSSPTASGAGTIPTTLIVEIAVAAGAIAAALFAVTRRRRPPATDSPEGEET